MPSLDVIATCNHARSEWSIAVANRHEAKAVSRVIALGGDLLHGNAEALVLSGDSMDSYNDVDAPDRVVPEKIKVSIIDGVMEFPSHSVTILKVCMSDKAARGPGV